MINRYSAWDRRNDINRLKIEKMKTDHSRELIYFYGLLCSATKKQYGRDSGISIDDMCKLWYPTKWNAAKANNKFGTLLKDKLRKDVYSMMRLVRAVYWDEPWVIIHKKIFLANTDEDFKFVHERCQRFIKGTEKTDNRYLNLKAELMRNGVLQL